MRRAFRIIELGLAVLVANIGANIGQVAHAGFVSANVSGQRVQERVDYRIAELTARQGTGAAGDGFLPKSNESGSPKWPIQKSGFLRGLAATLGSSNGMSPPSPEWNGSQSVFVLPEAQFAAPQLAVWLGREGRSLLPAPLSTGIFRPPRFVG